MSQHPRHELDKIIHSPVRLSIIASLEAAGETDFAFLRDTLEISDSLLSKHIATLEAAGYVKVVKGSAGRRPVTWFSLTDAGHAQFIRYKHALMGILGDPPGHPFPGPPVAAGGPLG